MLTVPRPALKAYVKIPPASPGEPLSMPKISPPAEARSAVPQETPKQEKKATKQEKGILRVIVVVRSDSLWKLSADNYGMANDIVFKAIQAMNPEIVDINKIYVGQRIKLPIIDEKIVVVKPKDNLYRIAVNNYGAATDKVYAAILEANPHIKDRSTIKVGQMITLPKLTDVSPEART